MTKLNRYLLAVFLLLLSSVAVFGQRTWFEFDVSKPITDKLEFSLAPQIRFKEGFELNEYFLEPGIEYEFSKYFAFGGSYRIGNNLKKDGSAQWFGRYSLEAKTGYDSNRLEAQFRVRYTNYDDLIGENNDKVNYLRFKFKLEYDIKKADLKPYAVYEIYRNLRENEFAKNRWEAGLEYKINKDNDVGAFFRFHDYPDDKESMKIIGIYYQFSI